MAKLTEYRSTTLNPITGEAVIFDVLELAIRGSSAYACYKMAQRRHSNSHAKNAMWAVGGFVFPLPALLISGLMGS